MNDFSNLNLYHYIPNGPSNLIAFICFLLLWIWTTLVFLWSKQWWFGINFFMGLGLETIGYISRYLSHSNPYSFGRYVTQSTSLTIAPAFFMGGIYYMLAKFSVIYGSDASRLKPLTYSYIFVSCDTASILLQGAGGGILASGSDAKSNDIGLGVQITGLAFQVASTVLFFVFCLDFIFRVNKKMKNVQTENPSLSTQEIDNLLFENRYAGIRNKQPMFKLVIWSLGICSGFIFIRCVYRLIELAQGWNGYLMTHEVYFLCFEALTMFLGILPLAFAHPGFLFPRGIEIPIKKRKNAQLLDDESTHSYEMANNNALQSKPYEMRQLTTAVV